MITVRMTLDEELVKKVDARANKLHISCSAFARDALKEALRKYKVMGLERKHKAVRFTLDV